ncbi:enoyl-CoA hydratase [Rhizobiaceae bacterium n13]|uniref:Enoyl-CoA hydratase domain-containing protein 3, mitochondrial n=1 Tax=Ferirhizobium litorale TaxID=2927786 RepID=A0AAE3U2L5_9HYPH|nr:enoyl-CoA hydratase [Fererhizobium litorale]MDI7860987.1 enoyl-CoA hydratase [Fererhizobium litorale]MDI7921134.1 enoyl-CoA hydratase [Fererhizobium litorale]
MAEVVSFKKDAATGQAPISVAVNDGVARLTLANPPANALSIAVMETLMDELDKAAADRDVRVVVIASTGKVFSAGHDLKEMTARRGDGDRGRAFFERTIRLAADLMLKITHLPKPVIAEIDGLATAAGCQLVASCDLAICTDKSTFCTPGVNIGLFCSTPMVAVSRAAHRKQAMEMLLTGETIDASTAKDFGLVNRIVPQEYLSQVVQKYASVIASKSPLTLKIGKEAFYRQIEMPVEEAYDYAARVMVENMLVRDAEEGIGAFLEKRHPEWTGE